MNRADYTKLLNEIIRYIAGIALVADDRLYTNLTKIDFEIIEREES